MIVEELEPEHLEKIDLNKYEQETAEAFHVRLTHLVGLASLGPAYAFMENDKVIAVGGIAHLWGAVGEAWLLSSTKMQHYGIRTARAIKKRLLETEKEMNLTRLQAQAPVSHPSAHRWIKWLGMEQESVARKYTATGEDAIIYAKVRNT